MAESLRQSLTRYYREIRSAPMRMAMAVLMLVIILALAVLGVQFLVANGDRWRCLTG